MNARRKLKNQVHSLQDTSNDSWINDKYFFEHVAKDQEEKKSVSKSESDEQALVFQDFGSDDEPGIGPPKILSKKIKKEKKEKKDKKKKKKKDRKEKKSKKEKIDDHSSD